jgi:site-specific DNA-adenine methylase
MSKRYGIVYMGSKEKILDDLIRYILDRHFEEKYFVDLFAGGFSVSSYILQKTKRMNVIANDLNKYVIGLYREILDGGKNFENVRYDFINRERFEDVRDNPDNFPDWYVGFVLNVWSFGCNQKDYLYAKDLEENKRIMHEVIVNDNLENFDALFPDLIIPKNIRDTEYRKHKKKRVAVLEYTKRYAKQIDSTELMRLQNIEHLNQTEHLSAVRSLVPLKSRIELYNLDWKEVYNSLPESILSKSVIYCDPPYEDTKQYQVGKDFDYQDFWQWFRECPYPVYVSSYKAPDDIETMKFAFKAQLLDNGHLGDNKPKKVVKENLYWNGKGEPDPTMEDLLFPK